MPNPKPKTSPVSLNTIQTFAGFSLIATDRHRHLTQYRAKLADDMSVDPVHLTDELIMREVLPPPPKLANSRRPPRKTSPFASLTNADSMKEAEVSALFVRLSSQYRFSVLLITVTGTSR